MAAKDAENLVTILIQHRGRMLISPDRALVCLERTKTSDCTACTKWLLAHTLPDFFNLACDGHPHIDESDSVHAFRVAAAYEAELDFRLDRDWLA